MAYKATTDLFDEMLATAKSELDGGYLYIYSGPIPATPDEALDMDNAHTQLARLTESNDGTTGLTFEAPLGAVMAKDDGESWEGTITFNGAEDGETTLTATFFRLVTASDDPSDAATGPRIQGAIGGPSSSADLRLASTALTANGSNTVGVAIFTVRLNNLA